MKHFKRLAPSMWALNIGLCVAVSFIATPAIAEDTNSGQGRAPMANDGSGPGLPPLRMFDTKAAPQANMRSQSQSGMQNQQRPTNEMMKQQRVNGPDARRDAQWAKERRPERKQVAEDQGVPVRYMRPRAAPAAKGDHNDDMVVQNKRRSQINPNTRSFRKRPQQQQLQAQPQPQMQLQAQPQKQLSRKELMQKNAKARSLRRLNHGRE